MVLGIVSVPGILLRLDHRETAPARISTGFLGWLGIYVAYPAWAIWLGIIETRQAQRSLASGEPDDRNEGTKAPSWTGG